MCLAVSFQETQLVFSGDLYRSAAVRFQCRPLFKTTEDSVSGHSWWRGCLLRKGVMEYNAAICTRCPLLYVLCTTRCNHALGLAFTPIQSIYCILFLFQSLKVKRAVGTELLGIGFSFLRYAESQEDGPTQSGGEQVQEGQDMYICWLKIQRFPNAKNTEIHTQIYAHVCVSIFQPCLHIDFYRYMLYLCGYMCLGG